VNCGLSVIGSGRYRIKARHFITNQLPPIGGDADLPPRDIAAEERYVASRFCERLDAVAHLHGPVFVMSGEQEQTIFTVINLREMQVAASANIHGNAPAR
jgi:hypothetical protein